VPTALSPPHSPVTAIGTTTTDSDGGRDVCVCCVRTSRYFTMVGYNCTPRQKTPITPLIPPPSSLWHPLDCWTSRLTWLGCMGVGVGDVVSQNVIQLSTPLLLTQLLNYLEKDDPPVWEGYALAAAFAVVPMVGSMFNQYSMKVRTALPTARVVLARRASHAVADGTVETAAWCRRAT